MPSNELRPTQFASPTLDANTKAPTILVIDDDAEIRYSLARVLSSRGYVVSEAPSGEQGVAMVKKGPHPDLIYLDIRMTGMSGLEALQHIRSANPKQLVILMTAFGTAQTAIEAMKFGALDYVMKPFDPQRVLALAENALKTHADLRAVGEYKPTINTEDYKEGIVGSSPVMQEVFKVIGQVTASDVTVMITGESGTGKELVARSIWKHSHRAGKPFIAVNCAAIPDNLIESELFGHEKGSFTGATVQRIGKFELCDGGTIFLDEIGDMALATQTKILRVLQQGEIQRVGGTETIRVDVRIIAATNKDLEAIVKTKAFREDLYYRLNVVRIRMPPASGPRERHPADRRLLRAEPREAEEGADLPGVPGGDGGPHAPFLAGQRARAGKRRLPERRRRPGRRDPGEGPSPGDPRLGRRGCACARAQPGGGARLRARPAPVGGPAAPGADRPRARSARAQGGRRERGGGRKAPRDHEGRPQEAPLTSPCRSRPGAPGASSRPSRR